MAEAEKEQGRGGSFFVKYIVIGIIVVINILLVAGVSLFVYNSMRSGPTATAEEGKEGSGEEPQKTEKELVDIAEEFRIPTRDDGMVILKVALGVSTSETKRIVEANLAKVYDAINTFFIKRDRPQIQADFIKTGKNRLHSQLVRDINTALKNELGIERSWFSDDIKQEVVSVYFKSFLTTGGN